MNLYPIIYVTFFFLIIFYALMLHSLRIREGVRNAALLVSTVVAILFLLFLHVPSELDLTELMSSRNLSFFESTILVFIIISFCRRLYIFSKKLDELEAIESQLLFDVSRLCYVLNYLILAAVCLIAFYHSPLHYLEQNPELLKKVESLVKLKKNLSSLNNAHYYIDSNNKKHLIKKAVLKNNKLYLLNEQDKLEKFDPEKYKIINENDYVLNNSLKISKEIDEKISKIKKEVKSQTVPESFSTTLFLFFVILFFYTTILQLDIVDSVETNENPDITENIDQNSKNEIKENPSATQKEDIGKQSHIETDEFKRKIIL